MLPNPQTGQPSYPATELRSNRVTQQPIYPATLSGDIVGGITTFFTMAYIVVVNPGILASQSTGMAFSGVLTATVLLTQRLLCSCWWD